MDQVESFRVGEKVREGGAERHVTASEAFLLQLTKRALEGDDAAAPHP